MSSKLLAFKTNFAKQKKQRDRGEEVKPFNVQFRYYGQMSMINLRKKSKVLVDFVRCQKKKKKKKKKKEEEEKLHQEEKQKGKKRRERAEQQSPFLCQVQGSMFSGGSEWCRRMRDEKKIQSGVRLCD